jgi:NhaP-type Na+/H+ or K+/H+ antiporter
VAGVAVLAATVVAYALVAGRLDRWSSPPPGVRHGDGRAIAYAVLSLTAVRMLPLAVALAGAGLRRATVAFMGWFVPRGLASVVFTLVAVEALGLDPATATIARFATVTILLSVFAHGLSARPLASAFGNLSEARTGPDRELRQAAEPTVRRRL